MLKEYEFTELAHAAEESIDAEQVPWRDTLIQRERNVTPIDRQYHFLSIYCRKPGEVLAKTPW